MSSAVNTTGPPPCLTCQKIKPAAKRIATAAAMKAFFVEFKIIFLSDWLSMLNQFQQHAVGRRGMHKCNQTPPGADTRRFVDQSRPFAFQVSQRSVDIINLNGDMVNPRTP